MMNPEQRERCNQRQRERYAAMSTEDRNSLSQQQHDRYASVLPEERERINQQLRENYATRTPEQRERVKRRIARVRAAWTTEQRKHCNQRQREYYATLSPEKRSKCIQRQSENSKKLTYKHKRLYRYLNTDRVANSDPLWSFNFYCQIVVDNECHYCWGPLPLTGPGLDRIDSNERHFCYNVVPCCERCNSIKLDHLSYEQMMMLAPTLREAYKKDRVA